MSCANGLLKDKCPIQQHPAAKDETDLELALVYAANNYPGDIYLFGVLGGRLDQTLANILLLTHPDFGRTQCQVGNCERNGVA